MRSGMAKGESKGSFFLLWPALLGLELFKIICAAADHPADVKLETVGVKDGGAFSVSVNARIFSRLDDRISHSNNGGAFFDLWTVRGMSSKVLRRMQHENQRIESVSRFFCESAKLLGCLVDLIGIEPMTSSMPWKCQKPKLLTVK